MVVAGPGPRRGVTDPRVAGTATREALVAGAIAALREVGFVGASAREIADRADASQGSIFYHFGSVNGLLLAALDHVSATILRRTQPWRAMRGRSPNSSPRLAPSTWRTWRPAMSGSWSN